MGHDYLLLTVFRQFISYLVATFSRCAASQVNNRRNLDGRHPPGLNSHCEAWKTMRLTALFDKELPPYTGHI